MIYGKQAPTLILEKKKINFLYVRPSIHVSLVYKITTPHTLRFNWDGEHYFNIIRENILDRLQETHH